MTSPIPGSQPAASTSATTVSTVPISVAFWNLQNLFDTENSAIAADMEFTPVNGWDRRAFEAKIRNLAEVIRLMGDGRGPDLLGICEVENEKVAQRLIREIGRSDYKLAHVENPDFRGLDTSLIYSDRQFRFDPAASRGHLVHQRHPTRDIFEVRLQLVANDAELIVLVNHWPSRRPGRIETEPFRQTLASQCSRILNGLLKVSRKEFIELQDNEVSLFRLNHVWDRNVLLMGDFNDEPWDRSVMDRLSAGYSIDHLEEPIRMVRGTLPTYRSYAGRTPGLFNPMWSLLTAPDQGTSYDSSATHSMALTDQFLLSRGLYMGRQGLRLKERAVGIPEVSIFRPELLTTRRGRPREFRLDNRTGFSDHFPITTTLLPVTNESAAP